MLPTLITFSVALFLVVRGAVLATKYASRLAESFRLPVYTVGFIVVAVISILPETIISITSALQGIPSFGLGVLFGSNVADLTLVFALVVLLVGRGLKVEGGILKYHDVYPFLLVLPLILGFDGHFSRVEGAMLIAIGALFYYSAFKSEGTNEVRPHESLNNRMKNALLLLVGMALLLLGSHYTVLSGVYLATLIGISPVLIGMLVVGLGTTLPELFFALKSVEKREDALAIGDVLGTVLADATIVVGILALISPFSFPQKIIYITGAFMVVAGFLLFQFMRSRRTLSKREAWVLILFWLLFVLVEYLGNT